MTGREKKMGMVVGTILLVVANYLLVDFFFKNRALLSKELATKKAGLEVRRTLFAEKDLWQARADWLKAKQPKLVNASGAGVAFFDSLKVEASKHNVILEAPTFGNPEKREYAIAVPVTFDAKSNWENLGKFLKEIQKPESFIVFETSNIQIDPGDKTQMRAHFRAAKWYATP